jgi:hypothetical protein
MSPPQSRLKEGLRPVWGQRTHVRVGVLAPPQSRLKEGLRPVWGQRTQVRVGVQ